VIEKNGEPVAAVVPIELYEQWKRRREAFFEHMRQVAERANVPEDEAQALIEEAITAVRAATTLPAMHGEREQAPGKHIRGSLAACRRDPTSLPHRPLQ
jgi:hypothetical protein